MNPLYIGRLVAPLALAAAALTLLAPAPASAARAVTPPQWFACGTYWARTISIGPPRIWSGPGRPEQVSWVIQVERWNGARWYNYGKQIAFWSTFNYYGQSVTSWSALNTSTGGRYVNSKLNLPVAHAGYYRLAVAIGGTEGGARWTGYVRGGASCYMN